MEWSNPFIITIVIVFVAFFVVMGIHYLMNG